MLCYERFLDIFVHLLCIHYTISFIPSTLQSLYVCILHIVLSLVEILSICTVILKVQLFFYMVWIKIFAFDCTSRIFI